MFREARNISIIGNDDGVN